jgi:hypothetical protein
MNKITIKQIKQMIYENVSGIVNQEYITKQSGTNLWFIRVLKASPEESAIELKELGFKIIAVNLKTGMILANYEGVNQTTYVDKCHHFEMQANGHMKMVKGLA